MARTGELPFATYYGSVDATPLWLILLGETHDWTGDDALVDRLWPNALAALAWIDRYGDLDGDGFVEYRRRAELGLHQPGLEGLDRRDPRPGRPTGRAADRPGRGPGLRPRRQAADGPAGPPSGRDRPGRPPGARGRRAPEPLRRGVLDGRRQPLRDGPRPRQATDRRPRLEHRPGAVGRDRRSGPRVGRRRPAERAGARLGLGRPDVRRRASPATTRSATTPARSGPTTTR